MFVIKLEKYTEGNEYEINDNIAYIKLQKKDGSIIDTKIDAEDIDKVIKKGTWIAQWHKDFNSYLVQTLTKKATEKKQTLQSFLMDVSTKAPIRHLNGDTLDNRRCNLEIYEQNKANDYEDFDDEAVSIILRDKYGKENARTLVDKEDLDRVINSGYSWVYYKSGDSQYAVANTPDGKVFLNRFIMKTQKNMVTHAINLNSLDNRKVNLEHKEIKKKNKRKSK